MACREVSNLAGSREEPEGFELQDRVSCQCGPCSAQYNAMSAADWESRTRTQFPEPPRDCRRPNSLRGWVHARPSRCSLEVRERAVRMGPEHGHPVRPREQVLFARPIYAP
jgi:hypothetical protein